MKTALAPPSPVSAEPSQSQSCPCSTKRVSWPDRTLKTSHINQLSPLSVSFSGGRAESRRQVDIWREPEAPGQVSQKPEAQPISVILLLEEEVTHGGGAEKIRALLWFMTRGSYRIPPLHGWFLLPRYTKAARPASVGLRFQHVWNTDEKSEPNFPCMG